MPLGIMEHTNTNDRLKRKSRRNVTIFQTSGCKHVQIGDRSMRYTIFHGDMDSSYTCNRHPKPEDYTQVLGDMLPGSDPNERTNVGLTHLHLAAADGNFGTVKLLLDHGADANAQDNGGGTPLHYAAANGHRKVCDDLIKHGADPDRTDEDGWTARHYACGNGRCKLSRGLEQLFGRFPRKSKNKKKCGRSQSAPIYLSEESSTTASSSDVSEFESIDKSESRRCSPTIKDTHTIPSKTTRTLRDTETQTDPWSFVDDENGVVDFPEFIQLIRNTQLDVHVAPISAVKNDALLQRDIFHAFDDDGNGFIDKKEIVRVFQKFGENLTDDDLEAMLSVADCNGNGVIDSSEFSRLLDMLSRRER